jgi:hypothetical protein
MHKYVENEQYLRDLFGAGAVPPTLHSFHAYWTWNYEYFYRLVTSNISSLFVAQSPKYIYL